MPGDIMQFDGYFKTRPLHPIASSLCHLHLTSPSTFDDLVINAVSLQVMSDVVKLSAGRPAQSISEVLAPGIVSLFVQGLETGLVISQLSQWLYLERREGIRITLLVVFVTTVGLSAFFCFFSHKPDF